MAIYPPAIQRPITVDKGRRALTVVNRVNLHVAVAESDTIHHVFNRKGAADSHFYVRKDGTVEQYVDTAKRANADLDGNDATISIETQGGVNGPQTEPWTPEQAEAIAQLYAWAVKTHGIAAQLASDSKLGASSKGLSWHRLGIDGNFPAAPSILAGRSQRGGGMRYSSARGKVCPGDAKIQQIPSIFERAKAILGGASPAPKAPAGGAATTPKAPSTATRNADGSITISEDKQRGAATIARWQEVLGTHIDGKISKPSALIAADQRFLNSVVPAEHIRNLTGANTLKTDGIEGKATIAVRQFWLYNQRAQQVLGRAPRASDFDGKAGPETTWLHQYALNRATARSGRY